MRHRKRLHASNFCSNTQIGTRACFWALVMACYEAFPSWYGSFGTSRRAHRGDGKCSRRLSATQYASHMIKKYCQRALRLVSADNPLAGFMPARCSDVSDVRPVGASQSRDVVSDQFSLQAATARLLHLATPSVGEYLSIQQVYQSAQDSG